MRKPGKLLVQRDCTSFYTVALPRAALRPLLSCAALIAGAALAATIAHAAPGKPSPHAAATGPVPRFGAQTLISGDFRVITSTGGGLYEVVGNATTWSNLQPDGQSFDPTRLADLDVQVRQAFDLGIRDLELRISTAGPGQPFAALPDPSTWPVDMTDYGKAPYSGIKGGEYLGGRNGCFPSCVYKLPPLDLSDNGPFYRFVYDLVSRYDGNTPDPLRPGEALPQVRIWSVMEEPDTKSYWYGTTKDYFGGVAGNPRAGLVPVFARAVKAADPSAIVLAGGITSHNLGLYLAHQLSKSRGNVYNSEVRDYGRAYFSTWPTMANLFNSALTDSQLFQQFESDPERARARLFVERSFDPAFSALVDGIAIHMYDNYRMFADGINLYHSRLPGKPIWATEIGFTDNPLPGQDSLVSEGAQAEWLFKKTIIGLSEGVTNLSYFPLYALGLATDGFREILPTMATWRAALKTTHMLGNTLNELNGFTVARRAVKGGITFTVFSSPDRQTFVAAGWNDSGTETVNVRWLLGIPFWQSVFLFDKVEAPVTGVDLRSLPVSSEPLFLLWSAANIDMDADGYPKFFDCDDANPAANPGAVDLEGNGVDDDCNPVSDPQACLSIVSALTDASTTTRVVNLAVLVLLPLAVTAGWKAGRRQKSPRRSGL